MSKSLIEVEREIISPFFDREYYLAENRDLQNYDGDLLDHFILHGHREFRRPNREFVTSEYLERNPDVYELGVNPFAHYLVSSGAVGPVPYPFFLTLVEREIYRHIERYFDQKFYVSKYKDLLEYEGDLILHYIRHGWREGRDPAPGFNTSFYLSSNPDIAKAGINPLFHYVVHGWSEGRDPCSHSQYLLAKGFLPKVSVIIPNFNHRKFLRARVESIIAQKYENLEIIFLDDASTDDSVNEFRSLAHEFGFRPKIILNDRNSGSVFQQWKAGIESATGDLLWICESDDTCAEGFLKALIPHFSDRSVMIAFGKVQFCDADGNYVPGLDDYREKSAPGGWNDIVKKPAAEWFVGPFGERNIIPNVGGCLIRNQKIEQDIWRELSKFRIVGDWYFYMMMSRTGQIVFDPSAVSYFRQHGRNTSVRSFQADEYYREHFYVAKLLRERWGTPSTTLITMYGNVLDQYSRFKLRKASPRSAINKLFDIEEILAANRKGIHICLVIKGFYTGGGEIYPIRLANAIVERGFLVSVVLMTCADENPSIANMLDSRVSIYHANDVRGAGAQEFLDAIGAHVVHTHYVGAEFLLLDGRTERLKQDYVVSLHGSYEVTPVPEALLFNLLRFVDRWYYLDEKNLSHFFGVPISRDRFFKVANGVSRDKRSFPLTRSKLGFKPNDFIFAIATRAIPEKGWLEAIKALKIAQSKMSERRLGLLLCGDGPLMAKVKDQVGDNENIKILGFQDRVQGLYRIADCALLPTRFKGESFPLTLIEAFISRTPAIATDVGQISGLLNSEVGQCGLCIPYLEDDVEFVHALADSMVAMANDSQLGRKRACAALSVRQYKFEKIISVFTDFYRETVHGRETSK